MLGFFVYDYPYTYQTVQLSGLWTIYSPIFSERIGIKKITCTFAIRKEVYRYDHNQH
jgi:hypothetical protein